MYDYIVLMNIYVCMKKMIRVFFFSSRRRHTRWPRDWSSDVCSSDLELQGGLGGPPLHARRGDRRFEGEPGGDHGIVGIDHRGQPFTGMVEGDRKSTRLNSSHVAISYAVFCLKKKK